MLYVEYQSSPPIGLVKITPKMMGRGSHRDGAPQYWFQWGRYVIFDPLPLASYTYTAYVATPPTYEMSADADTPQVPVEFYEDIVTFAKYRALIKRKSWGQSGLAYQQYVSSIQEKRMAYLERLQDGKATIVVPETIEYVAPAGGAQ